MNYLNNIRPQVRDIHAYTLKPERASIKLNQNENPWGASEELKSAVFARMAQVAWSRYPDFVPQSLQEKVATYTGWQSSGVLVGNGSNELIQALLSVTMAAGKRVLLAEPTFLLYRQIAEVQGGEAISVLLSEDFSFPLATLKAAILNYSPEVTILCSPNNPTGSLLSLSDLVELLETTSGLIAVDEAYGEFAGTTAATLLPKYPNLVVLRTFSKAFGLAAWRIGYLLAAPELTREIGKGLLPYNLNPFAQATAEIILERYETEIQPQIARIRAERERLYLRLAQMPGLSPVPSSANFLLVRSAIHPPSRIYRELLRKDILIRDVSHYPLLSEYFRVSLGTPEENDQLLAALQTVTNNPAMI